MKIFNQTKMWVMAVLMVFSMLACNSIDHDGLVPLNPDEISGKLEGVWKSDAYGFVLDIHNGVVTAYDVTEISGVKRAYFYTESDQVSTWNVRMTGNRRFFVYRSRDFELEIRFKRIDALPEVCQPGKVLKTTDAKVNFDVLWQTFKEHYAFFELRGVTDWDALKAKFRSQVTEENLFDQFRELLGRFSEDHVGITKPDGASFQTGLEALLVKKFYADYDAEGGGLPFEEYIRKIQEQTFETITTKYLNNNAKYAANNKVIWGTLEGNVGYLNVTEMSGYTQPFVFEREIPVIRETMKEVMADLKGTKGLVIDMRFNGGGRVEAAKAIAAWFADQQLPMVKVSARNGNGYDDPYTIYFGPSEGYVYSKPIIVLTSAFTASASEYFVLAMRNLPRRPVFVGESTNGVFSRLLKTLPNGWTMSLSNEKVYDMNGKMYEKTGIPVDVEIPISTREDRKTGRDSSIDYALKVLR